MPADDRPTRMRYISPAGCRVGGWRDRPPASAGTALDGPWGGSMAAVDDLTELVERAAAAEKLALASKWKDQAEVQALIGRARRAGEEQRQEINSSAGELS